MYVCTYVRMYVCMYVCMCFLTCYKHKSKSLAVNLWGILHILCIFNSHIRTAPEVSPFVLTSFCKVGSEANFSAGRVGHQLQMITKWQPDALGFVLRWPLPSPSGGGTSSHHMSQRMPLQALHEPYRCWHFHTSHHGISLSLSWPDICNPRMRHQV